MILIFGGTTEGRIAAETLDRAGKPFYYSTRKGEQKVNAPNAIHVHGEMNEEDIADFVGKNGIELIVDAAHPFATNLHQNIDNAIKQTGIKAINFTRKGVETPLGCILCDSFDDAIDKMLSNGVKRLLALTGVQTIKRLKRFWRYRETYFRILNRNESIDIASAEGLTRDKILFYDPTDPGCVSGIRKICPDAILTKESGESGGLDAKIKAATEAGINLYVVKRPRSDNDYPTVYGKHGLIREVEKLLPDFFELKTGITTGTCATAAAKAALEYLLTDIKSESVLTELPDGELLEIPVNDYSKGATWREATVIKDAGDDPDVTDGCRISARVWKSDFPGIEIKGGAGVGKVTLPGLGLEPGDWAINPVPREMIRKNLSSIYPAGGLTVEISVEDGEKIAEKTFNRKVGVVGGISILGTSGIVMPFSHEAFVESIRREISVAKAAGAEKLIINSGARSESILRSMFPNEPPYLYIHYGNAIREILEEAEKASIRKIIMGIMIGKAVKMAEGHLNTHSHNVRLNKDFIIKTGKDSGLSEREIKKIENMNLARELWDIAPAEKFDEFYNRIKSLCEMQAKNIFNGDIEVIIIKN